MAIIPQVITEDKASGAQVIDGSLKFDSTAGNHLERTPSTSGNRRVWTWSGWVKRQDLDSFRRLFEAGSSTSNFTTITWQGDNNSIELMSRTGGTNKFRVKTARLFRDLTAWYHVVVSMNILNQTQTEKCKIYINGERITDFDDNTQQNEDESVSFVNGTDDHFIGSANNDASKYNGHMSQVYLIDGIELDPSYFGFTDPLTGTWRPKKYTGDFNYVSPVGQIDYESGFNGQSMQNVDTTWLPFSGNTSNNGFSQSKSTTCTYTAPGSGIAYTSTIRLFVKTGSGGANNITIDGNSFTPDTGSGNNTGAWNDISSYVTGNLLNTIVTSRGSGGRNSYWSAIEVDGVILTHFQPGYNGFYLPFDGNSPIGKDQSGSGNDFTPVNFGGSNTIEKATGALPILNTVNGGNTAAVGTRTDAYASNLVLAVPLIGNTQDYSGQINSSRTPLTFSVNGNAAPTTAQSNFYGGSYTFDGTTDSVYSTVPNSDALLLQNSNFTVECWARIASGQTDDRYFIAVAAGSATNSDGSWYLRIFQSKFEFVIVNGNTQYKTTGVNNYVPDKWTHIAFVREGNAQRLYINGILETTQGHTVLPNLNNSSSIFIGSSYGYNNTINGQIQDARIYDNVAKYTSNFIPASTSPDILPDTPSGVAYGSELTKITDGAVTFDGSLDFLALNDTSDFSFGGDFTVEAFVYQTVQADHKNIFSTEDFDFKIRGNGKIRLYTANSGTDTTQRVRLNTWTHLALVRESGTIKVYFDGVGETVSQTIASDGSSAAEVGRRIRGSQEPFDGFISNLRVVKGTALYTSDFTPPTEPLTAVTNTKLLCCQSINNSGISDAAVLPSYDITVKSSNGGSGSVGALTDITSSGNYYYDNRPSQGGTGSAWIQIDFASTQSSVTSIKLSGGGYANGSTYDLYVNGVLVENDRATQTVWAEDTITISSTNIDSIRIEGSDGYAIGALKFNDTLVSGTIGGITANGDAAATNFNPFTDDINAIRGQETGYATWNSSTKGSRITLSNGNLDIASTASTGNAPTMEVVASIGTKSGKYYVEWTNMSNRCPKLGNYVYGGTGLQVCNGGISNGLGGTESGSGFSFTSSDVIALAVDFDNKIVRVYKNNFLQYTAYYTTDVDLFFKDIVNSSASTGTSSVNFGQKPFKFPPPDGFQPLCSANLPRHTKAAIRPDEHFKTMVWSGDNTTRSMTGLGFRPDLVWIKCRTLGAFHNFTDSVRGPKVIIQSNTLTAEQKPTTHNGAIDSFDPDGFTLGTGLSYGDVNQSGRDYVGWAWKGGTPENYTTPCGSVLFDGSGDYLSLPVTSDFQFGSGDFTIECWAKAFDQGTDDILGIYNTGDNRRTFALRKDQTESVQFLYSTNGSSGTSAASSAGVIKLGTWHHYAVVRDNYVYKIYLDGVLVATDSSSTDAIYTNNDDGLRIGSSYNTDFDGQISNVRIIKGTALYTSNFTPPTAPLTNVTNTKLLCCQSNTSADAAAVLPDGQITVNNNSGTAGAYAPTGLTGGIVFPSGQGTSDHSNGMYLSSPSTSFAGNYTIEFWFNVDTLPSDGGGGYGSVFFDGRPTNVNADNVFGSIYGYNTTGSSNDFTMRYHADSVDKITGSTNLSVNTWYHYALVRNNGTVTQYINGTADGSYSHSTAMISNADRPYIGGWGFGSGGVSGHNYYAVDGKMSNLRMTSTAVYTANFTPPTSNLTAIPGTTFLGLQSTSSATAYTFVSSYLSANGNATPTTHNPFDNYRVDGRVYTSAADAGLTAGTITPTGASVNTESGFSILTWTGDGANSNLQIPHGLSTRPKMVVIKKRNEAVDHWYVAHDGIWSINYAYRMFWGPTKGGNLPDGSTTTTDPYYLATQSSNDTLFLNNTTANGGGNENNIAYVAYCWSEISGFSKFGTYTGNGATNGPLIECGFRPAWVMVKVASGSTGNSWTVWDNKRDPDNEMNLYLHPNEAQQDGSYSLIKMDFYSNGFKPRGDIVHQNTSGVKYIYAAFAEAPTFNLYGGQANAR